MDALTFDQLKELWTRGEQELMIDKRTDYATLEDVLSNFKFVGFILEFAKGQGCSGTEMSAIAHRATKLCREIMLSHRDAVNETLEETFSDDRAYTVLHQAIQHEERRIREEWKIDAIKEEDRRATESTTGFARDGTPDDRTTFVQGAIPPTDSDTRPPGF